MSKIKHTQAIDIYEHHYHQVRRRLQDDAQDKHPDQAISDLIEMVIAQARKLDLGKFVKYRCKSCSKNFYSKTDNVCQFCEGFGRAQYD